MRILCAVVVFLVAAVIAGEMPNGGASAQRNGPRAAKLPPIAPDAGIVVSPGNLGDVMAPPARDQWQPRPNGERPRGGVEMYAAAAPAVVVVRTSDGHGTGFFVSADGLLVTNHHVINSGLAHNADSSSAQVHLGSMGGAGIMSLRGEPVRAALYKTDPVRDLALLKIQPPAGQTVPYIKLADTAPRPGLDCAIIGHPSSGMLWTFRPCQVASVGSWPKDLVNLVMPRLAATSASRQSVDEFLATQSGHRILLTSAQANPGDSGGPVLNAAGALIGVTFAGPGNQAESKFTYHVHLDEVRSFIASVPKTPMLLVPDPWSLPARVEPRDLDGDRTFDVLVAGSGDRPEVLMFDLDGNSPRPATPRDLAALIRDKRWDFEVAIDLRGSGYTSYYDTDNDGTHDLILITDEDSPAAKGQFVLRAGNRWGYEAVRNRQITDPALLRNAMLAQRLVSALQRLGMN